MTVRAISLAEQALEQGVRVNLAGMPLRDLDMSHYFFGEANLKGADLRGADLRGSNFRDTLLDQADLRGADLRGARNLSVEQLARAVVDESTRLPEGATLAQIEAARSRD